MKKSVLDMKNREKVVESLRKAFEEMFMGVSPTLLVSPVLIPYRKHRSLNLG